MIKKLLAVVLALFAAAAMAASVDANKATQAELEAIKGIGPSIATKILDERKKGSFKDWQDMVDRVKGVGEGNAAKFSTEGLTVNGTAFKGAAPAAAKKDEKPAAKAVEPAPAAAPAKAAEAAPAKAPAAPMKAEEKKAAPVAAAAAPSAEDKKAAAKKEKEDKKAAKAAAAEQAKKDKEAKKAAKAAEAKPAAADAKASDAKPTKK